MKRLLSILAFLVFLGSVYGCGLSIRAVATVPYPPSQSEVKIYNANQILPEGLKRIGSITIDDTGFTLSENGTYEACLAALREEAKKMGGNVVNIVNMQAPDSHSTIYRMTADVYREQ